MISTMLMGASPKSYGLSPSPRGCHPDGTPVSEKPQIIPGEPELVDRIDLTMVKMKLCLPVDKEGKGWSQERADEAESQYRMFLKLCAMFPEVDVVPTGLIDEMWHQHILDTRAYAADCYAVFGKMLHHFPYFGLRGEEDAANLRRAFATTVALFSEHFGIDITKGVNVTKELSSKCNTGTGGGGSGCSQH